MSKLPILAIAATFAATASVIALPATPAKDTHCAMINGSGIGLTEGIARWMATNAVIDSANKWASSSKYTLAPVKVSCTNANLSCKGSAKACKS